MLRASQVADNMPHDHVSQASNKAINRLNDVHKQFLLITDYGAYVLICTLVLQVILQIFRLLSEYVDSTAIYNTSCPVSLPFL